ncbi:MAG: hypothetical protein LUB61_04325 [Eggerthellaceae bacterium]|nr:hypothetical protein [Eggerthellaceae bacterium]
MSKLTTAIIKNNKGGPMLTADKIRLKNGQLVMNGNILGTMPGQFYISPLDLYRMYRLVDKKSLFKLLKMLRQGKKEYRALEAEENQKS